VRSLVQFQINRLIKSINTKAAAVFKDSDVAETLPIYNVVVDKKGLELQNPYIEEEQTT
jgi:hypothetical protein